MISHCQAALRKDWCGGCAVLTLGVLAGALLFAYACAYHWYVVHDNPLALREIPLPGLTGAKQPPQPAHAQVGTLHIRCLLITLALNAEEQICKGNYTIVPDACMTQHLSCRCMCHMT